jgi:hypothetical protein
MSLDKIDITELLENYAYLLKSSGMPEKSTEIKLLLSASEEIKKLRSRLDFQIHLADKNNISRLKLLDVVSHCRELYAETCREIRETSVEDYVCGMCKFDCDHGLDGYANECPGFETDDCFELDYDKYNSIVSEKNEKEVE